jgi:hypothetical protein
MFRTLSIPILLFCLSLLPLQAQQTLLSSAIPLQQGYAVITPTSGTGGGLVAYETVGDLQGLAFQTAILPVTTLTTSGAVIVDMSTGANSLTGPSAVSSETIRTHRRSPVRRCCCRHYSSRIQRHRLPLTALLNLISESSFTNLVIPPNGAVDLGPQDVSGKTIF